MQILPSLTSSTKHVEAEVKEKKGLQIATTYAAVDSPLPPPSLLTSVSASGVLR